MTGKNATPQLITKDDVLAWYYETDVRGRRERRSGLWQDYALRPEDVWALIEKQEGYCPICRKPLYFEAGAGKGIAIDHEGEKQQGHVRGVLHNKCNSLLGLLEDIYGDPDSKPTIDLPHEYLDNLPAKNIKVRNSTLYDDKIENRLKRGHPGRKCQRQGCKKKIPATKPIKTKYCSEKCGWAVRKARASKKLSERRRKARQGMKCLFCGKRFNGSRSDQEYCSPECQQKARNARRRKNN